MAATRARRAGGGEGTEPAQGGGVGVGLDLPKSGERRSHGG